MCQSREKPGRGDWGLRKQLGRGGAIGTWELQGHTLESAFQSSPPPDTSKKMKEEQQKR